jgi:uncharacterized protein YodC (DUF2158 family)
VLFPAVVPSHSHTVKMFKVGDIVQRLGSAQRMVVENVFSPGKVYLSEPMTYRCVWFDEDHHLRGATFYAAELVPVVIPRPPYARF